MLRDPVRARLFVVPPDEVPYEPSTYHLVWDISSAESHDGPEPDYRVLCQPTSKNNEQLVAATPDALPDRYSVCTNCERRLRPGADLPDVLFPDDED